VLQLEWEIFFIFNTFFKLFPNLTLLIFFKTTTFGCAYYGGAAKPSCRAMHGGAREAAIVVVSRGADH